MIKLVTDNQLGEKLPNDLQQMTVNQADAPKGFSPTETVIAVSPGIEAEALMKEADTADADGTCDPGAENDEELIRSDDVDMLAPAEHYDGADIDVDEPLTNASTDANLPQLPFDNNDAKLWPLACMGGFINSGSFHRKRVQGDPRLQTAPAVHDERSDR